VPIGRNDLALVYGLLLVRDRRGQLAVQIQHGLHQRHHPVVARDVGRVGEVDGKYGELERYGRLPATLDWIGVKRRITGDNWNLQKAMGIEQQSHKTYSSKSGNGASKFSAIVISPLALPNWR
jgi:hypothetical protein